MLLKSDEWQKDIILYKNEGSGSTFFWIDKKKVETNEHVLTSFKVIFLFYWMSWIGNYQTFQAIIPCILCFCSLFSENLYVELQFWTSFKISHFAFWIHHREFGKLNIFYLSFTFCDANKSTKKFLRE